MVWINYMNSRMQLYRDNPDHRNSCGVFSFETVRKFMWGYVPAKERLQHEGDSDIKPGPHHLTFVNHFSKYDRQLSSGKSRRILHRRFSARSRADATPDC